ncbi:MAG: transposase [Candidatus Paceibacterota bacterium]|jgi:REP element-mobilizing transposase RayT
MLKSRKSNRLPDYDYSQDGYYFVTICIKNKKEYFGKVEDGKMILNKCGEIAKKCWLDLPSHYKNCILVEWIIMPNHMHGIIAIDNTAIAMVVTGLKPVTTDKQFKKYSLSEIIRGFKTFSSRCISEINPDTNFQWQRSFYDHVIRNERSLLEIRGYIQNNPIKWELDRNNPENLFM